MDISSIILAGENQQVEFKTSFNNEVIETLVAFANAKGGSVFVGISDNGEVHGVSVGKEAFVQWLNEIKTKTSPILIPNIETISYYKKNIIVFSIQEYPIKPVATRGKYSKRIFNSNQLMATTDVVDMHLQTFNSSWDYHIDNQHKIDDLSFEKVQLAIDILNKTGYTINEDPIQFLVKNDLVRNATPSHAAFLLFKKNDSVLTTIELGRFQTEIIIKDSARSKDDILTQIEKVLDFVKKHINKEVIITGEARNTQKWQYPIEAIREIVMNMIVHRDYRSSSDSIVKIFDHKIEFYNPGRLPENITVDDLLSNNYKSTPRNKLIADFCKNLGLIEKYGSGIGRIMSYFADENLPLPQFRNISDGFMVTISSEKVVEKLNQSQRIIIENMRANTTVSAEEIAKKAGISTRKIQEHIKKLKELSIIKRIGPDKGGHWEVMQ